MDHVARGRGLAGVIAAGVVMVASGVGWGQCAGRWIGGRGVAGVDGSARAFLSLDDDTVLVGGLFSLAGTTPAKDLAIWDRRLGSFRAVPSFEFGGQSILLSCLTRLPDGRIVAGGEFGSDEQYQPLGLVLVDPVADRTTPVSLPWSASVFCISLTPDGRALLGGGFNMNSGAVFTPAGIWDPATNGFEPLIDESVQYWTNVRAVLAHSSGELLIGFEDVQGLPYLHGGMFRWDAETNGWQPLGGGVWPSGDPTAPESVVDAMIELPNGDVLVGGKFSFAGELAVNGLARYSFATGQWVSVPQIGTSVFVEAMTAMPDGSIIVAGSIRLADGETASTVRVRLDTGELTPLSLGGSVFSYSGQPPMTVLPDGGVLMGMDQASGGSLPPRGMTLLPPGADHWTLVTDGDAGYADTLALMPNGEVVASGQFTRLQGVDAPGLATYDPSTGRVRACSNLIGSWARSFSPLPDGTLVASYGVAALSGSAALQGVGVYDPVARAGYVIDPPEGSWVFSALPLPSGEIIAVLELPPIPNQNPIQLALLDPATGAWTPVDDPRNCSNEIYAYPGGRVLVRQGCVGGTGHLVESLSIMDPHTGETIAIPIGEFDQVLTIAALPNGDVLAFVSYPGSGPFQTTGWVRYQSGEWVPQPLPEGVSVARTPLNPPLAGDGDLLFGGTTPSGAGVVYRYAWRTGTWEATTGDLQSGGYLYSAVELPGGDIILVGDFPRAGDSVAAGFARWTTLCHDPCDADINGDGVLDQGDMDALVNIIAGGGAVPGINPDFNHDGAADQGDVDALVNVIAGGECP